MRNTSMFGTTKWLEHEKLFTSMVRAFQFHTRHKLLKQEAKGVESRRTSPVDMLAILQQTFRGSEIEQGCFWHRLRFAYVVAEHW